MRNTARADIEATVSTFIAAQGTKKSLDKLIESLRKTAYPDDVPTNDGAAFKARFGKGI